MSSASMSNSLSNYFAGNSALYQQFCNQFSAYDPGNNGIPLASFQKMCLDAQNSGNSQLAQIDALICSNPDLFNQLGGVSTSENPNDGVSRVSLQDIYGLIGQSTASGSGNNSNYPTYYPQPYYPQQQYYPQYNQQYYPAQSYYPGYGQGGYPAQSYPAYSYPVAYYPVAYSPYPATSYYSPYSTYNYAMPTGYYPAYAQQQQQAGYPDLNWLLNAAHSAGTI